MSGQDVARNILARWRLRDRLMQQVAA